MAILGVVYIQMKILKKLIINSLIKKRKNNVYLKNFDRRKLNIRKQYKDCLVIKINKI